MSTITCPICWTGIPVPVRDHPVLVDGVESQLDGSYVDEHVDMHERCTCIWEPIRTPDGNLVRIHLRIEATCPIHG